MTNMEVRKEVKALVIRKGLENIINADLNEIQARTGAECMQIKKRTELFRIFTAGSKIQKVKQVTRPGGHEGRKRKNVYSVL